VAIVLAGLVLAVMYWRRKARRNNLKILPVGVATNDEKPVFPDQGGFPADPKHAFVGTAELPSRDYPAIAGDGQMRTSSKEDASNVLAGGATINYTTPVSHTTSELPGHDSVHEMAGQHA
jgi:hypothetical protein